MSGGRSVVASWRDAVRDSELDRTAKLVAFVLSTYMDGDGRAYPSMATLAEGASLGLNRATTRAAVARLESARFLDLFRSRGRGSHHYAATFPTEHLGRSVTERFRASNRTLQGLQPNVLDVHESAESAESVTADDGRPEDGRTSSVKFDPDAVALAAAKEASKRDAA